MSYQVLARKWRPRTFHELVGQEHVQRALVNALDQGRLHHAYLFTGTRGVGKTTLARILAKCLNCTAQGHGDEGITSTPCGVCDSCRAIDEGRFVDLIEVDAASRTKVEDTRELLDNVQYAPTQGRYKVYLIDEVHMLSTHSFNALLKTLEEPPPHVKFLLATTDPQKLPVTVLSRCLQFTLKNMAPERIVEHLTRVLEAESVPCDESALWLLGKAADGSMRDALSLTDQAIAFGQGQVRHADVAAMLGTLDHRHVLVLLEALAEVDAARVLAEVAALAEQGPDFAAVLDDVTGVLHRLAIAQMVPEALDNGHGDRDVLLQLAARFTAEDVQLYYQIGIQGRGDMEHAPDLRMALEMTLLRMLAFRPQGVPRPAKTPLPLRGGADDKQSDEAPAAGAPDEPASSTPQPPSGAGDPPFVEAPSAPAPVSPPEAASPVEPKAPPANEPPPAVEPPPWEERDASRGAGSAPGSVATVSTEPEVAAPPPDPLPAAARPAAPALEPAAPASGTTLPNEEVDGRLDHAGWLACFESLGLGGLTRNLAANCVVEADDGERLSLRLDPALSAMNAEVHVERITRALAGAGIERRLSVEEGPLPEGIETPRLQAERLAAERHAEAVEALSNDPHVRQLQQAFGARLIESTVKPADAEARG
ncbi:DNA polymerase III subunit gamma/tau [Halomonas kalidii]|uniref:DNA polymerase III subunit gamma/tau n=1 Tax=Halomonas kalidii TaxID=3043293 RepID=A0ABT6VJ59_9GAMM|nr:DNA polymerase III subunit gamma/tau [Halomonas kalidii]MDI5934018.1 DNA polymerase III subunit gamma/tau [Halomonas kalidii]